MKANVKITRNDLIKMLLAWNYGTQPASIQYVTEPKINKEGKAIFGTVTKIAAVGGLLGYDYENSVNLQLKREGKDSDFVRKPLWNGKGVHVNALVIKHVETGELYISYKYQQTFRAFHFDSLLNFIPYLALKSFFYASKPTNQGVDEGSEVLARTVKIANVRKVKFRKTTYEVI